MEIWITRDEDKKHEMNGDPLENTHLQRIGFERTPYNCGEHILQ